MSIPFFSFCLGHSESFVACAGRGDIVELPYFRPISILSPANTRSAKLEGM